MATELNHVDVGPRDGPSAPLVLIHGIGGSLHHWSAVLPELAADRRVVAVDLPGCGDSPALSGPFTIDAAADAVLALLDRLGLPRCVLVGHSFGALVALRLAQRPSSPAATVVLVDGHLLTALRIVQRPLRAATDPRTALALAAVLGAVLMPGRDTAVEAVLRSAWWRRLVFRRVAGDAAEDDVRLLREVFARRIRRDGVLAALRAARRVPLDHLAADRGVHTTLIWGADDPLLPRKDHAAATALLGATAAVEIRGCGHWPMLERRGELVRQLRNATG